MLTDTIWKELPTPDQPAGEKKKIEISTIRRNLQREHMKRLATMVLGPQQNNNFFFIDEFHLLRLHAATAGRCAGPGAST